MNNLIILFICEIILLICTLTFTKFDLFSPSFIVDALFTFCTGFALSAYKIWNYDYLLKSTIILLIGLTAFNFVEWVLRLCYVRTNKTIIEREYRLEISSWKINFILIYSIIAGIIIIFELYRMVKENGYSGGFNINAIANYCHRLSFRKNVEKTSSIVNVIQHFFQSGMYILLFYFIYRLIILKDKFLKNIKLLLPLAIYILILTMRSNRGQLIVIIVYTLFICYILTLRNKKWSHKEGTFITFFFRSVILVIVIVLVFYSVTGLIGRSTIHSLYNYVAIYIGGPIIHFNQFIFNPPTPSTYFGQETFGNIYSILNKLEVTHASFSLQLELRNLNSVSIGNVYTFFRRPYQDFGMIGMCIVTMITSFFFSSIYYRKVYRQMDSYESNYNLILYAYLFRVVFLVWFDNYWYNIISFGMFTFFIIFKFVYVFAAGKIGFGKMKIYIRKGV